MTEMDAAPRPPTRPEATLLWIASHWRWLATVPLALYAGLALAAPLLAAAGLDSLAGPIYWLYHNTGHPPSETRYLLLGEPWGYGQRDAALFTAALLVTAWTAIARPAWPAMPIRLLLLLSLPMFVDAISQLPGWRESDAFWRTVTGGLFGGAAAYFAVTRLGPAFDELRETIAADRSRKTKP